MCRFESGPADQVISKTHYEAAMARVRERGATVCGCIDTLVIPYWNATNRFSIAPEDTLMCRVHNPAPRPAVLVSVNSSWEEFVVQLAHGQ